MSPHWRSWIVKTLLICCGFLAAFALLEGGFRIDATAKRKSLNKLIGSTDTKELWAIYDPDIGFRPNPKFGQMNSDGLRDHPIGPKEGNFRLLFLGDSIAENGDDLEDTFVAYLRAELHKDAALAHTEVINAGVVGYTNYQELLFLKKYGLKYQPDLVGVEFCLNDLEKFVHLFEIENGKVIPARRGYFSSEASPKMVTRGWIRRLTRKSLFLASVWDHLRLSDLAAYRQGRLGFVFDYDHTIKRAWQDFSWKETEDQMREMVAIGRSNHFAVFLVIFPISAQYNADYLARDHNYVLKPQRKLLEICGRLGIPCYDLYPDLNASMFMKDGIHLTKMGRQQVGRLIAAFLMKSSVFPDTFNLGKVHQ